MEKLICAPVIIPTLNRAEHFVRCIESLKKCKYAERTEIFISVDFPFLKRHEEGYDKIKKYLKGTFSKFSVPVIIWIMVCTSFYNIEFSLFKLYHEYR